MSLCSKWQNFQDIIGCFSNWISDAWFQNNVAAFSMCVPNIKTATERSRNKSTVKQTHRCNRLFPSCFLPPPPPPRSGRRPDEHWIKWTFADKKTFLPRSGEIFLTFLNFRVLFWILAPKSRHEKVEKWYGRYTPSPPPPRGSPGGSRPRTPFTSMNKPLACFCFSAISCLLSAFCSDIIWTKLIRKESSY